MKWLGPETAGMEQTKKKKACTMQNSKNNNGI
jgi:hypothetical protein